MKNYKCTFQYKGVIGRDRVIIADIEARDIDEITRILMYMLSGALICCKFEDKDSNEIGYAEKDKLECASKIA